MSADRSDEVSAPTPLELMAFADGELDDARAEEVALWLESHEADAARVSEMATLGCLVDDVSAEQHASLDIADDVMAAIDRIDIAERNGKAASISPPPRVLSTRPAAPRSISPRAANRRRTYVLGVGILAVAAAAAATLVAFVKDPLPAPSAGPVASLFKTPDVMPDPTEEQALDTGTAVDTVDFGSHQGAIFYVPSGASTSTTVIWIAEDESPK